MTKKELVAAVQDQFAGDLTKKQVGEIADAVFEVIAKAIREDGRYSHPGFGTFSVKTRAARTGRNPRTGEKIPIPASRTVGFKPAPDFKTNIEVD
jgi:DNA-binding protein HU-beta